MGIIQLKYETTAATIEEEANIHNTRKGCNSKQSSALQWIGSQMDLKTDPSKARPGVWSSVLRGSDRCRAVGPGMGMGTCYKPPHSDMIFVKSFKQAYFP